MLVEQKVFDRLEEEYAKLQQKENELEQAKDQLNNVEHEKMRLESKLADM